MSDKKFIVVLGDGMADEPIESLGGKHPFNMRIHLHLTGSASFPRSGWYIRFPRE